MKTVPVHRWSPSQILQHGNLLQHTLLFTHQSSFLPSQSVTNEAMSDRPSEKCQQLTNVINSLRSTELCVTERAWFVAKEQNGDFGDLSSLLSSALDFLSGLERDSLNFCGCDLGKRAFLNYGSCLFCKAGQQAPLLFFFSLPVIQVSVHNPSKVSPFTSVGSQAFRKSQEYVILSTDLTQWGPDPS